MYDHLVYQSGKVLWQGFLEYQRGYLYSPYLAQWFPWFKVSLYGVSMTVAFLLANYFLQREIHRRELPATVADNIILLALFGGLVGAKFFYFFEGSNNWSPFLGAYDLIFRYGGLTWYGGLITAGILIIWYLKKKSISLLSMADYAAPLLAFGYGMGRLGCLLSGDGCYGIAAPEDVPFPWAASFANGSAPWIEIVEKYQNPQVRVYNTPLMEAIISFSLMIIFYIARLVKDFFHWKDGFIFFAFLLLHSLSRFVIEFWRLNEKIFFGLTQAQVISIILFAISFFYLIYLGFFRIYRKNA